MLEKNNIHKVVFLSTIFSLSSFKPTPKIGKSQNLTKLPSFVL